jgi:hypothetical protein
MRKYSFFIFFENVSNENYMTAELHAKENNSLYIFIISFFIIHFSVLTFILFLLALFTHITGFLNIRYSFLKCEYTV